MSSNALTVVHEQHADVAPYMDREKIQLVKDTILKGASDLELQMFINLCNTKRLDPMSRQIYGIKTQQGLQMFASIDGLRVIAQRSGEYAGQVGPFWCGSDGQWTDVWLAQEKPAAAKVGVLRKGWSEPMWGVATLRSYGKNSPTWSGMVDVMLAKCAESLALRKAFPDDLSGLYVREELSERGAVDADYEERPPLPPVAPKATKAKQKTEEQAVALSPADQKLVAGAKDKIHDLATYLGWDGKRVQAMQEELFGYVPKWNEMTLEQATITLQNLQYAVSDFDKQQIATAQADAGELPIDAAFAVAGEPGNDRFSS